MHASRGAPSQGCSFERRAHTLLVECVPRFMQRREQGVAEIGFVDAGGDPHVAGRELGAEWMMGLVEAAAIEVIAVVLDNGETERELLALSEGAAQAGVIGQRLVGNGTYQRH